MKRILYYEDDNFFAKMMTTKLEQAGFVVRHLSWPGDVIREVKSFNPDLIFMDIIMPHMDGLTATKCLKADRDARNIPVFGMSNLGAEADRKRALATGMVDYWVSSEHTPTEVVDKIRSLLKMQSEGGASAGSKTALTVHEALGVLDRVNRATTWKGSNAAELEAEAEMDPSEWERAGRDYARWRKDYHRARQYTPHVIAGAALLAFILIHEWRTITGLVAVSFGYWAAHRDGHSAGYGVGYEIGRRNTIFDAHSVSEEDASTMRDKAREMSVEADAVRMMDRKNPGAA